MPEREAVTQEARGTQPSGARRGEKRWARRRPGVERPLPAARPRADSPRPEAAARGAPARHHRTSAAAAAGGGSAHQARPPQPAPPTLGRRRRAGALREGGAGRHRLRPGKRRGTSERSRE